MIPEEKQNLHLRKTKQIDRNIEIKRDGQTDKPINQCSHGTTACEVWEKKEETEKHQNALT